MNPAIHSLQAVISTASRDAHERRGQTTLDFAVGASVFLLATAFVFAFVPGMIQPFAGQQSHAISADRAAEQLSADLLAHPAEPYVLDASCTKAFFAGSTDVSCRFDSASPQTALGAPSTLELNISIENSSGTAALDGQRLSTGEPLPSDQGVRTARRTVHLEGAPYTLFVRVW